MSVSTTPATGPATAAAPLPGTAEYLHSLTPGSPERAAAAVDLFNGRHVPGSELAGAAPQGVPSKFWQAETGTINTDALLQSYLALEKRMGGPPVAAAAPGATPPAAAAPAVPGTAPVPAPAALAIPPPAAVAGADPVAAIVTAAGLNPAALAAKINGTGLDAADFEALAAVGIPKALVDAHVEAVKIAQESTREKNTAEGVTYLGGEARSTAVMTWASTALPPAEVTRLNTQLNGPAWRDALDIINSRFSMANPAVAAKPAEPTLRVAATGLQPSVTGYRSTSERTRDMQNPLYKADAGFRAGVTAKMQAATYDLDQR